MYIVLRSPQGIEYNPTQTVIHILLPSSLVEGWLYIYIPYYLDKIQAFRRCRSLG